jgi:hypothetical protein
MDKGKQKTLFIILGVGVIFACIAGVCLAATGILGVGLWQKSESVELLPEDIEATVAASFGEPSDLEVDLPDIEATVAAELGEPVEDVEPEPVQPTPKPVEPPPSEPVNPAAGMIEYSDPDGFYSLAYPSDWVVQRAGSQNQFCTNPEGDVCLAVTLRIKSLSYQKLRQESQVSLSETLGNYQEHSEENTFISGLPALLVEQSYTWQNTDQHGFTGYLVRNRIGIEVMAWTPEDAYAQWEETLREMVQSFQITSYDDAPLYEDWDYYQSEHMTFYYLPGTWIEAQIQGIAEDHEWAYGDIEDTLNVSHNGIITFFLYPSQDSLYRSTARQYGFAINEGGEVHSLWQAADNHQSLGHEMTHVITHWTIGEPTQALLGEGIAVCMDHSGKDFPELSKAMIANNQWVQLGELVGDTWFDIDPEITYPQSGSFVCYLMENYDLVDIKALYTAPDFESGLNQYLQVSMQMVEADWLTWIQK